jgi:multidrug efflux pump subunit AcrA (membrane-fusion protein)
MNSRTLLILGGIVLVAIIVTNIFTGNKNAALEENPAYEVETVMAGALTKEIMLQKSALMKAGTQANITAQASGRIGGIYVRAGERVIAGQILAEIDDTYGTTNNADAARAFEKYGGSWWCRWRRERWRGLRGPIYG